MPTLTRPNLPPLAYETLPATVPGKAGLFFIHGFRSDMHGQKALALAALAEEQGLAFTRFDCRGHGASGGDFVDFTIGGAIEDALAVFDACTEGKQIVIGSSMGGWVMLHLAMHRPERVAGLVGIAAAPDFPERLLRPALTDAQRAALEVGETLTLPSCYSDEIYPITPNFMTESRAHHVMQREALPIHCPVTLLHGLKDADVPWEESVQLAGKLATPEARIHLLKTGDHRLSEPAQLALLQREVQEMLAHLA